MKSNRKALLALIGAIIAAVAVAYGTGTFDRMPVGDQPANLTGADTGAAGQTETAQDAAPAADAKAPAEGAAETAAAPAQESAGEPQQTAEATAQESGAADVKVPGFDLLRVEPSGDMVIAGNAAPGSKIEIVSGADVLTTAEAGSTGDFVAILDERLKPGDHQIVLRATSPDGTAATSAGTAIVSVPETPDGEVLALVEEPGQASRLISASGGTGAEAVDTDSAAVEVADAGEAAEPAAGTEQPAEAAAPATEEAAAEPAAQPGEGTAEETQMASVAPAGESTAEEAQPEPEAAASAEPQAEAPAETAQPAPAPAQSDVQVAIEAVEIEGSQVFVAGAATPGHVVRVYANNILLGDARTSPQGRFLIETRRDLPEGDYIVRADVLAPNRSDVIARAAVPFQRSPGENIAAVAAPAEEGGQAQAGSETQVAEAPAQTAAEEQPAAAEQAPAASEPAADSGKGARVSTETATAEAPAADASAPQAGQTEQPQLPELQTALATTPPEITAPALQPVDRSVIIRRGDTLWHISRRVYGRGIRYTTIYKANSDQIRDPDMIFPGQVFGVPETSESGEPADMSQLEKQDG